MQENSLISSSKHLFSLKLKREKRKLMLKKFCQWETQSEIYYSYTFIFHQAFSGQIIQNLIKKGAGIEAKDIK